MNQEIAKTYLNDLSFVELLEENGFDIHNIGGTSNNDFIDGQVNYFKNGQTQLVGETNVILTCSANTFYKTLLDVEERFNYQLFG